VTPEEILPLRNVPVITPDFALEDEELNIAGIAEAIGDALLRFDLAEGENPVALCFDWLGSASYRRTHDFLQGVTQGLSQLLAAGHPLVLVCEGDIGKIFGTHAAEELKIAAPIVSIDGIALEAFDFIDIGAMLPGSGAVPVVIKSLLFPRTGELGPY
jgi:ethanolamine utilization protein EutA